MRAATPSTRRPQTLLPPRGFVLALVAQVPFMVSNWPLHPYLLEGATGATLIVCGVFLNICSERLFQRTGTGVRPFSPATELVRRGPFRLSRNPMYLGMIAISVGLTLATGVLANIWISAALAIWLHHAYVLPEEEFVHDRFGTEYQEYAGRVPRWMLFSRRRRED